MFERFPRIVDGSGFTVEFGINREQYFGLVIGGAPDHDAIDVGEVVGDFCERGDSAIDRDRI